VASALAHSLRSHETPASAAQRQARRSDNDLASPSSALLVLAGGSCTLAETPRNRRALAHDEETRDHQVIRRAVMASSSMRSSRLCLPRAVTIAPSMAC